MRKGNKMGKSITCNYHCTVNLSNGKNPIGGAMTLKEVLKLGDSYAKHYKADLVKIDVFPQTAAGRKVVRKDFLIMTAAGTIDRFNIGDSIPMYCF